MAEIPSAQKERSSGLARNCPNLGKAKQRAQTQALPRNLKVISFLARFSQPMVVLFSPYNSHLHSSKKKKKPTINSLPKCHIFGEKGRAFSTPEETSLEHLAKEQNMAFNSHLCWRWWNRKSKHYGFTRVSGIFLHRSSSCVEKVLHWKWKRKTL